MTTFSQVCPSCWMGPSNSDAYICTATLYIPTVLVHMLIEIPATTTLRLTDEASNVKYGSSPSPFPAADSG